MSIHEPLNTAEFNDKSVDHVHLRRPHDQGMRLRMSLFSRLCPDLFFKRHYSITVHSDSNAITFCTHPALQPPSLTAPSQPISIPSAQCTHSSAQRADDNLFHSLNVSSPDYQQDADEDGQFETNDNAGHRNEYTSNCPFPYDMDA